MPSTMAQTALDNEKLYHAIENGMEKLAADAIDDYTRLKMREDGITRRVIPALPIQNSDLDRQVDTSLPAKVIDMEVNSPAALTAPLGKWPTQVYIHGMRYRVLFSRILSPWFTADVDELRTHVMDIRQVLSDNSTKDMLAEEDAALFALVNSILGAPDTPVAFSGVNQWQTIPSSISRNSLWDSMKIMPSTDGHLMATRAVINNTTIMELNKFGRDEMGGDMSQELFKNGWTSANFMGVEWLVTLKRHLVPDNTVFYFADPKFLGKFFVLEDSTMFIERKAYFINFFQYENLGLTIANPYGLARVDFAG